MCGIVGAFKPGGMARSEEVVATMRDCMPHRGPDGVGIWSSPDRTCTLGHRRLSIIDLSDAAAQPMLNAAGTVETSELVDDPRAMTVGPTELGARTAALLNP